MLGPAIDSPDHPVFQNRAIALMRPDDEQAVTAVMEHYGFMGAAERMTNIIGALEKVKPNTFFANQLFAEAESTCGNIVNGIEKAVYSQQIMLLLEEKHAGRNKDPFAKILKSAQSKMSESAGAYAVDKTTSLSLS